MMSSVASAEAAAPVHVVYVGRDGSRVHVAKERLIVDAPDGLPQMSIPRRMVSRIVLTGNVGLSAGARSWALYNDIDVIFLSRHGGYLGQLAGPRSTASARRLLTQASLATADDARQHAGQRRRAGSERDAEAQRQGDEEDDQSGSEIGLEQAAQRLFFLMGFHGEGVLLMCVFVCMFFIWMKQGCGRERPSEKIGHSG